MRAYRAWEGVPSAEEMGKIAQRDARKLLWFLQQPVPYAPHVWQTLFHGARDAEGRMARFRHLVAGRRGGKTLSAAEDTLYYILHPEEYWLDFFDVNKSDELWAWELSKDYSIGFAAWRTFQETMKNAGLVHNVDFKLNRGEKYIEFLNGGFIQFKTAVDPESLRGAGLNILWMDEAAMMTNADAYNVTYPALSDKEGAVICTTTPKGKNWYYEEFFTGQALRDEQQVTIEYTSIDNPYFPEREWKRAQMRYHPQLFKQEYMARFDSMAGVELNGEWLQFYKTEDLPRKEGTKMLDLKLYVGVDPAISVRDEADRFVMALIGITQDNSQVYLLDMFADRIPFPEQVDKLREWHIKYRPMLIGIESNAYQAALAQQAMRMANFPPIVPILSKGKKHERILSMAPYFKIGRIRIHKNHRDFVDEWLNYDSSEKNPKDDCLDAVEIALRTAGALLPEMPQDSLFKTDANEMPASNIEELAARDLKKFWSRERAGSYDDEMGEQ